MREKFEVGEVVHVNDNFCVSVNGVEFPDIKEVGEFGVLTEEGLDNNIFVIRMNKRGDEYFIHASQMDKCAVTVLGAI